MPPKSTPDVSTPLSDPVSPQVAAEAEASLERETFMAVVAWVEGELKRGLNFKRSEKPLWVRGDLVYVVDRKSYLDAKQAHEAIDVRA